MKVCASKTEKRIETVALEITFIIYGQFTSEGLIGSPVQIQYISVMFERHLPSQKAGGKYAHKSWPVENPKFVLPHTLYTNDIQSRTVQPQVPIKIPHSL